MKVKQFCFVASRRSSPSRHCPSSCLSGWTSCRGRLLVFQHLLVMLVLVLPALIGMKNQSRTVWDCVKSFLQHGSDHTEHRMLRDRAAYQILAAQIENRRQVQLLAEQGELGHVGDPFLVWLLRVEVPFQEDLDESFRLRPCRTGTSSPAPCLLKPSCFISFMTSLWL